jgi:uncharacterized protein involved in exopolysaccharide biosynthesis
MVRRGHPNEARCGLISESNMTVQSESSREGLSGLDLLAALWRNKGLILASVLIGALIGMAVGFLMTPIFTAETSILPQPGQESAGILGDVAAMAGLSLRNETNYENLYGRIVKSDRVLDSLLSKSWAISDNDSIDLFNLFGYGKDVESDHRLFDAAIMLKRHLREEVISFYRDERTGYMILKVHAPKYATVAADIANHLVLQLDEYNRVIRNAKAREHKEFIETQFDDIHQQLKLAEDELADFVLKNRSYAASPSLKLDYEVLQREVRVQEAVWTELRRQLELASIEENRNLVSVDVLDPATPPIRHSSPKKVLLAIAGALIGGLLACLYLATLGLRELRIVGAPSGESR